jgi:hypothetical protein
MNDICPFYCVTKQLKHVTILEPRLNREMFTQHGLHLNRLGKCLIAKQIAMEICGLTEEKVHNVISLKWKLETRVNSETINTTSTGYDNIEEQQNHPTSRPVPHVMEKEVLRKEPSVLTSVRAYPENCEHRGHRRIIVEIKGHMVQ